MWRGVNGSGFKVLNCVPFNQGHPFSLASLDSFPRGEAKEGGSCPPLCGGWPSDSEVRGCGVGWVGQVQGFELRSFQPGAPLQSKIKDFCQLPQRGSQGGRLRLKGVVSFFHPQINYRTDAFKIFVDVQIGKSQDHQAVSFQRVCSGCVFALCFRLIMAAAVQFDDQ